ncbi:hypothetical protein GCWU000324_00911 [Kingella oralis ATCC 51147]|uniref:Uncharacterized protein n=1 Tax=Kingella oralis ATCC 51147 TaxID=629741 RepID=C4GFJ5_9NEIS|nr:hypothetical protein GCWU000324_00911 [Kingella oralis ATCC 51147]
MQHTFWNTLQQFRARNGIFRLPQCFRLRLRQPEKRLLLFCQAVPLFSVLVGDEPLPLHCVSGCLILRLHLGKQVRV